MRSIQQVSIFVLIIIASAGVFSCKSQKKIAAEKAAAETARKIAKAKADLEELLSDNSGLTLDEKESRLQVIKDLNIEDPEVQELIVKVEEKLEREREALAAKERAEQLAREREERLRREESAPKGLGEYFNLIANSTNLATTNRYIDEAMQLFASEETPVLIIVSKSGDIVDYDRPTTIKKYLNYLKDQKMNRNDIENVVYDANGKITELELIKK
jgi:vacuolar-type H+-ATPase subunit I/STV1